LPTMHWFLALLSSTQNKHCRHAKCKLARATA